MISGNGDWTQTKTSAAAASDVNKLGTVTLIGDLRDLHQQRSDLVLLTHSDLRFVCTKVLADSNLRRGIKEGMWGSMIQQQISSEINAIVSHENLPGSLPALHRRKPSPEQGKPKRSGRGIMQTMKRHSVHEKRWVDSNFLSVSLVWSPRYSMSSTPDLYEHRPNQIRPQHPPARRIFSAIQLRQRRAAAVCAYWTPHSTGN